MQVKSIAESAILSAFIKLPFVIKILVLYVFEWLFYTCFTVSRLACIYILWIFQNYDYKECVINVWTNVGIWECVNMTMHKDPDSVSEMHVRTWEKVIYSRADVMGQCLTLMQVFNQILNNLNLKNCSQYLV